MIFPICLFFFFFLKSKWEVRWLAFCFFSVYVYRKRANFPVNCRYMLWKLHWICRSEPCSKLPSFRITRVVATFLVTATSLKTLTFYKLKFLWTIPLPWVIETLLSAYRSSMGYFPVSPFLYPSKNKCSERLAALEIEITGCPLYPLPGITFIQKRFLNLSVNIFALLFSFPFGLERQRSWGGLIRFSRPSVPPF